MNNALKEWSAVIAALDRGLQIFLLRKGGIVEAGRGFQLKHPEFLLFPTFEHQHARSLKPEYMDLVAPQPDGHTRITHVARVTDVLQAPSPVSIMGAVAQDHVAPPACHNLPLWVAVRHAAIAIVARAVAAAFKVEYPVALGEILAGTGCKGTGQKAFGTDCM